MYHRRTGSHRPTPWAPKLMELFRVIAGFTAIFILAVIIAIVVRAPKLGTPVPTPAPENHPLNLLAFFENDRGGVYGGSFPALQQHARALDAISPVWFSIHASGAISRRSLRTEVTKYASTEGIKVFPLITHGDDALASFLINPAARLRSFGSLLELARLFDGFTLDFEYLPSHYRNMITQYVRELYPVLAHQGKKLYLCLFPQIDFPSNLALLHDYEALAPHCDGAVLMAYDWRRPQTGPGPIAPIDWVEENLLYALRYFPPEKIWLGIPVYGYRWEQSAIPKKGVALPAREAEKNAAYLEITPRWDQDAASPYYEYTNQEGQKFIVWYENQKSAAKKYQLARNYRLAGVAIWRLGYEVRDFWDIVPERDRGE